MHIYCSKCLKEVKTLMSFHWATFHPEYNPFDKKLKRKNYKESFDKMMGNPIEQLNDLTIRGG